MPLAPDKRSPDTRPAPMRVIAVVGASGSGKTTLARVIVDMCRRYLSKMGVALLSLDAYYRDLSSQSFEQRDQTNFDHPDALEFELFCQHIADLRAGHAITVPRYDFTQHTRMVGGGDVLEPPDILVLEGVLLSAYAPLRSEVDWWIYVDTPNAVCLQRRIERDGADRGRSEASVRDFWFSRAEPMFQQFGASARDWAHFVVSGEQPPESVAHHLMGNMGFLPQSLPIE